MQRQLKFHSLELLLWNLVCYTREWYMAQKKNILHYSYKKNYSLTFEFEGVAF